MQITSFLLNLDVIIYVCIGLLLFLVTGIIIRDKPKNIKDYALGGKTFSVPVLVATMAATLIGGGSTIGEAALYYNKGLLFILPSILGYYGYVIFAHHVLPKLDLYYGEISVASVLSKIYGNSVERFAGIVAYMYCFSVLAMQVKAISVVIEYALGYNSLFATIASFLVIIAYSALGGVRSVIRTDVLQFLVFIIILPTMALFLLKQEGGMYVVFQETSWKISENFNLISYISLFVFVLIPDISPIFIHRVLIGKEKNKNKKIIYLTILMQLICTFFAIIIAAIAINKYQGIESNTVFLKTMGDVIQNNFSLALFAIAMLAVILSSADSLMNTGAIILVENVIKKKVRNNSSKLIIIKIVTAAGGLLGLFIALNAKNIVEAIWYIAQYYAAMIVVPFIGGLFIKNKSPYIFWGSTAAGFISYTALRLLFPEIEHTAYLISISMSFIMFTLIKFLVDKNIIDNKQFLIKLENSTENIIKQMNIPITKLGYAILPIPLFTIFTQIITNEIIIHIILFNILAGLIGISFIFVDVIFNSQRKIIRNCYILASIWYCFPFLSVYLYYIMLNSNVAFANMLISCTLLAIVFSSRTLVMFVSIGSLLGSVAFITLQSFVLREFLTQAIILTVIVIYIGVISHFILGRKEADIKRFIEDLIKKTSTVDNKKSLQIVNQYADIIDIVKKHEKAKEVFLEQRENFKGYVEFEDIVTLNIEELVETLKDYLSLVELEKVIKFNIENKINNITITKPESMIYTVIFSIAHYMAGFDKDLIKINISCKNKQLCVRYSLENLKLNIAEIKKYVKDGNRPDGIMDFELIEKIINKQDDMELDISQNSVILSIKTLTGEIKEENAKFINFSSQQSGKPKTLN